MKTRAVALAVAATVGLGACAQSENGNRGTEDHGMGSPQDMDHGDEDITFGSPGDPAQAVKTVPVATLDTLRFEPASVEVAEGETVTFSVTNPGKAVHELTLGDEAFQDEHGSDIMATPTTKDTPYSVTVRPGETKTLTWRFTVKGKLLYGCHQPGHYQGGMVGSITVT